MGRSAVSALFDTSVFVALENGRLQVGAVPDVAMVSAVTIEELYRGVLVAGPEAARKRRRTYEHARSGFQVLAVDVEVAVTCAQIRDDGRRKAVRYTPFDSLIGATARVHGLPLYTQDEGMRGMLGVDVRVV